MQGLVFSDAKTIKEYSAKLGAGEDLYALFAGILTMRPWNRVIDTSVDHLVVRGTESDRSELQVNSSRAHCFVIDILGMRFVYCTPWFVVTDISNGFSYGSGSIFL